MLAAASLAAQQPAPTRDTLPGGLVISRSRRMAEAELAKKTDGWFVTGLPEFGSDPVAGVAFGARGYLYFAGRRDDPLFPYTAYRARLKANLIHTTESATEANLAIDLPYFRGTPWRVKVDAKYQNNPNNLFFGLTEATLAPLPQGSFDAYAAALAGTRPGGAGEAARVTDVLRNRFRETEWMLNVKVDRALGDGRFRILGGYEIQSLAYATFEGRPSDVPAPGGATQPVPNGRSLLASEAAAGRVNGLAGGRVSIIQLGLIHDTRDFEPDPSRGLFAEVASEFSDPVIGSQFSFVKTLVQGRVFRTLARGGTQRLVLAGRLGVGNILGDQAPFFEFQDQWSTESSVNALGGARSLRGYRANRFLARAVAFTNWELRWRVAETRALGQRWSLTLAPFVDAGTVRDRLGDLASFDRWRTSAGGGVRVAWNQSTIISADWGFSGEDQLFFFGFGHPF
ncbi:MAG: DUF5982 domain-containing protein [Gemmatimonadales bacterium]|nr:DUF5982 domain-containing protein [Gemmatimonadales bacterium]